MRSELVDTAAARHGLDPALVAAVIDVESSGSNWAYNPEPRWLYLWDWKHARPFRRITAEERRSEFPPGDFAAPRGVDPDAEWWGQQASWGLMQVMGGVAREHGFRGLFLPQLCDPIVGLEYGARHLAAYVGRYGEEAGVAAYNAGPGGRNGDVGRAYAAKVLGRRERFA